MLLVPSAEDDRDADPTHSLLERWNSFKTGDWRALIPPPRHAAGPSAPHPPRGPPTRRPKKPQTYRELATAVHSKLLSADLRGAVQVLHSHGLAPHNINSFYSLLEYHPAAHMPDEISA